MDKLGPPLQRLVALFLVFAVAPCAGCQSVPESRGKTRAYFAKVKLTPSQIRLLTNEFAERIALRVEGVADRILAGSRSREVSRKALLWKIHGISAFFLASSRPDPLAALGDMTILAIQMRCFFEDGAASGAFGPDQPLAVEVSRELEREIVQIRSLLSDDKAGLERGLQGLRDAADRAPLTDLTFVRASIVQEYLTRFLTDERGVFEVVGSIEEAVAGLRELVVLQLGHFPKRMRWEAELLLLDLDRAPSLTPALESISSVNAAMGRLVPAVEALPATLREERRIIMEAVTKLRDGSMLQVDQMRAATLDDVRQERRIALAEVDTQLQKFAGALDGMSRRRVEEAKSGADALFGKALEAGMLSGLVLATVILAATFLLRRRP
jgi:hypothetical protein